MTRPYLSYRNLTLTITLGLAGTFYASPVQAQEADIRIQALLQTWATLYDMDLVPQADPAGYGDPDHPMGLHLHRARLGVAGSHPHHFWQVRLGGGAPYDALSEPRPVGLVDGFVGTRFPAGTGEFELRLGLDRVPFGREAQMSSEDLLFQERGVGTHWLSPSREVGTWASWSSEGGFAAHFGLSSSRDTLFGQLEPGVRPAMRLEYGQGDSYRTWAEDGQGGWGVGASAFEEINLATQDTGLGVDFLGTLGRLGLLVEGLGSFIRPTQVDVGPPDIVEGTWRLGATVQGSYWFPFPQGGLETGVRFSLLDDAWHRRDQGDVGIIHGGLTWRDMRPGLNVGAGYVHRMELGGRAIPNDTVRAWAQFSPSVSLTGPSASRSEARTGWTDPFLGTWQGQDDLEGATLALWEQPGMGLVGSFQMSEPRGRVQVDRPYPLDGFHFNPEDQRLRMRIDPHGDGTDLVWFELSPSGEELCGLGYEDGYRDAALEGEAGGAWVCWERAYDR